LVYALLSLSTVACLCSRMFIFRSTSLKVSRTLHTEALWAVIRSPMSWLDTTPTGRIVNRLSQDMQKADMEMQGSVSNFTDFTMNVCLSALVVSIYVPILLIVLLPVLFLYVRVQRKFRNTARELQRLYSINKSPIYQGLDEAIIGVSTIRAYDAQAHFATQNALKVEKTVRLIYNIMCCNRWLALRLKAIGSMPVGLVISVLFLQALCPGFSVGAPLTGASIGLVLRYTLQFTNYVEMVLQSMTNTELCLVALERLSSFSSLVPEPELIKSTDAELGWWPCTGEIAFNHVKMRYRPGLPLVLNSISFVIPGGTSVGVVGRTGAGKSSLLQGLFRMCPLESGQICIDGVDIANVGLHTLRRRLAIIPQDPVGFTDTLRFNLDPFTEKSDHELREQLEKVQMLGFVVSQKEGLEYQLTSGGENLSVGQRQLVCAARAFLRKATVLVLDEATASVDFKTDSLIQKALRDEMQVTKMTTLTIAHRINTILGADNVLVLDRGTAAEFGSPAKLASDPSSIFYTFVH